MTVVKATCPDCNDVKVDITGVTLRYLDGTKYEHAYYRFICPQCSKIVLKPTSPEIANVLYTSGAHVERYELSIELLQRPMDNVPPIDLDDVLNLGLALENEEELWNELRGRGGSAD